MYSVGLLASLVLACLLQRGHAQPGDLCPPISDEPSCVCNRHGYGIINATSLGLKITRWALVSPSIKGPLMKASQSEVATGQQSLCRFSGMKDMFGYEYSFNPCYPYSQSSLCANVHACQTSTFNPEVTYDIASGGTEEMYIDPDGIPYLYYTAPGGKKTFVYLHCTHDKTTKVHAVGDNPVYFEFVFHVYSGDICPRTIRT